jgi:hypothetical protein
MATKKGIQKDLFISFFAATRNFSAFDPLIRDALDELERQSRPAR